MTRAILAAGTGAVSIAIASAVLMGQSAPDAPPYTPEQSMALMQLEPGFRVELVASEPDVQSPVAMDIDEDGRIWVVEMPGYPLDVSATGRVKLLEDTDGDGRVDRTTLFADGLRLPSGVMRYGKGVLVTSPPDLLYLEDTNGDGRADTRKVVLTGFARTNPQHAVNHPVFGLDNWIYLAHSGGSQPVIYADLFGDQGSPLKFGDLPQGRGLDVRGRGVRVKPDAYKVEALSSRTQFGNAFDVYGHFLAHNNSIHQRHEVIAARYLERNPDFVLASAMAETSDHGNAGIMPITHGARFDLLTEPGQFTSGCALTVYAGGAFPDGYEGTTFIAEPVHNLVHRDILKPAGATFSTSRARTDMEFLASRDSWFRPVNLYVGPDGALYLIDYYRPYIEHPEWASSDLQRNPSVLSTGQDRGRIYRIVATGATRVERPRLGSADDDTLVRALGHPNVWWRRTAQRLLVKGTRRGAVPALVRTMESRPTALARLHALWTLEGLDRLEPAHVLTALRDEDPGLRENAIVLAERWLSRAEVSQALLALVDDPNPRVRFQLLATLGSLDTPASHAAQERLLLAEIDDPWFQVAALSASSDRAAAYFTRAMQPGSAFTSAESANRALFFDRLGSILGARQRQAEVSAVVNAATATAAGGDWWRAALLEGLARGVGPSGAARAFAGSRDSLVSLATGTQPRLRRAAITLLATTGLPTSTTAEVRERVTRVALDVSADVDARVDAVAFLAWVDAAAHRATFESLVAVGQPDAVQVEAVRALGRIPGAATPGFLLGRWPRLSTRVRSTAATVILARREGSVAMLDALERGDVKVWMLEFGHKRSLIMHRDAAIRARGRMLLEESPEARAARMAKYAGALSGRGDASKGADVFANNCAMCHQIDGRDGVPVGPDLATIRHRALPVLLADILEPNRSIAQDHETWSIERNNGETMIGVIGEQSPTTIVLRQGPGVTTTIPRSDIRTMQVVPQSLMPDSFAEQIPPDDMAHLLAYLMTSR